MRMSQKAKSPPGPSTRARDFPRSRRFLGKEPTNPERYEWSASVCTLRGRIVDLPEKGEQPGAIKPEIIVAA